MSTTIQNPSGSVTLGRGLTDNDFARVVLTSADGLVVGAAFDLGTFLHAIEREFSVAVSGSPDEVAADRLRRGLEVLGAAPLPYARREGGVAICGDVTADDHHHAMRQARTWFALAAALAPVRGESR